MELMYINELAEIEQNRQQIEKQNNMELIQTQIAFFFKNDFKKDFEWISLSLKELLGPSNKTLQIPIPDEDPSEIPRLTLNYSGFNINVAKSRLDIFILDNETKQNVLDIIVNRLFSNLNLTIGRFGYIKTYFKPSKIDEMKVVLNSNLQQKSFSEINIRVSEKFEIENWICNNIEKVDFGEVVKKGIESQNKVTGQIIQRDLNTASEVDTILTSENLTKLIANFDNLANSRILNL
jgi:hypothetical protein